MGINIGNERRKFYKEQEKLRKQYEEAGMTPEQIQAMYEFDLCQFNRDIAYYRHTQSLISDKDRSFDEEEERNSYLYYYLERLAIEQRPSEERKFWWLDEIDDDELIENLMKLSEEELEIIDKLAFCDLSQKMVSEDLGISSSALCQRIKNIRKKLRKSE